MVLLSLLTGFSFSSLAQVGEGWNRYNSHKQLRFERPRIPRNIGSPPRGRGGGSRGDCPYKPDFPPMMALVPGNATKLTVRESPTVWVYVPYTADEVNQGKFYLQNEDGKQEFFRVDVQLPSTPGVVGIQFPSTYRLTLNNIYQWNFEIDCPTQDEPDSRRAIVIGFIQRIDTPEPIEVAPGESSLDDAELYALAGIWYEAIDTLARLKLNSEERELVEREWNSLLRDETILLQELTDAPVVGYVTITNSQLE
ncbi:MAG: DUF928 domain-containing protein [Phormidium sp. BM_Day4_Bin.17]|nr:DUF928 domain-containing protein [Phormidium sp. BM_Day4_Bin.17]UCJ13638.1 MAG: DUF928 domain-containing protein [Phormidium sp. PBR-2020]